MKNEHQWALLNRPNSDEITCPRTVSQGFASTTTEGLLKPARTDQTTIACGSTRDQDLASGDSQARHPSRPKKQTDFLDPAPTVSTMTWVGPLVGTHWSATPINAPLAPSQVPSEKTTQHFEPMAPGRLEPETSTLSFLT